MKISIECATLGIQSMADLVGRCGFDALDLPAWRNPAVASACNALLTAPAKILERCGRAKVGISAINIGADHLELPLRIALATELNCRLIRMSSDWLFGNSKPRPQSIDRLLAHADTAAGKGITLLLENEPVRGSALRLWEVLDRLNHPSIACCWNTFSAAQAGDAPAVAVPVLNTRIRYVHLQDARSGTPLNTPANRGEGDLPLRNTLNRLRGIGYDSFLLIGCLAKAGEDPVSLEQSMTNARTRLQRWQVLPPPVTG